MKKTLLCTALGCASLSAIHGQSTQYLEAGNIRSLIGTAGHMWWDTATGAARCEFPKGSGAHVGFTAGLWVGGYDAQGQLKVAANTYRQGGNDFWQGAISAAGSSTPARQAEWDKVWKLTRAQLDSFFASSTHTAANTPPVILRWPARGNALATGALGGPLTELIGSPYDYAPFVDANGDNIYDALAGDYPRLKGDEMLWQMYNDVGGTKTQTGSDALHFQIGLTAWAYNRGTIADNIQFYEYTLTNRGGQFDSTVIGVFTDMDLGFSADDYMGVDTSRRLGYIYNADALDGTTAGQAGTYGSQIPIAGVTLLRTEGDIPATGYRAPAGAFTYFINGNPAAISDPLTAIEFYRYMTGTNRTGQPFTRDFTGAAGVPTVGYGAGPSSRYVFDGDPAVSGTWSECFSGNAPGDRRFLLSSKAFVLPAGETRVVAMALVASPGAGGCPATTLGGIRQATDTAIKLYDNPPAYVPPTPTGIASASTVQDLRLYPNPTDGTLFVSMPQRTAAVRIEVVDVAGRAVPAHAEPTGDGWRLHVGGLPGGVYALRMTGDDGSRATATFVKQ